MTTVLPIRGPDHTPGAAPIIIGVDAHADTFTAVAMQSGGVLWEQTFSTHTDGFACCLQRAQSSAPVLFAIEHVKAQALSLVLFLLDHQQVVYDLPPAQVAGLRRRGGGGKSDAKDARHVAQLLAVTLAHRTPVQLPADTVRLQSLERTRATLVSERGAMEARQAALQANPHAAPSALRTYARLIAVLREEINAVEKDVAAAVKLYPQVLESGGVATILASVLVGETLTMQRFPREAQFAS